MKVRIVERNETTSQVVRVTHSMLCCFDYKYERIITEGWYWCVEGPTVEGQNGCPLETLILAMSGPRLTQVKDLCKT